GGRIDERAPHRRRNAGGHFRPRSRRRASDRISRLVMNEQARAILWAQYRALRNVYPRGGRGGLILSIVINLVWYGIWVVASYAAALLLRETRDSNLLFTILSSGLLLATLYWQVIPVLMASAGVSLQMRRLRVYPVPHEQLFFLEVMLRVSTAVEMLLLVLG